MGPAIPYALAAKLAYPERCVVALAGDGAMQMLGNSGLVTIAQRWRDWYDPRLVILVVNNRDLNMVTWEQRVMSASPKFPASQDLPWFSFAGYAELLGLRGVTVDGPDKIGPALEAAFRADRPVLVDAVCDPDVPPLPPHISVTQAKNFWKSVLKGDPNRVGYTEQSIKQMISRFLAPAKETEGA
jgi:pyruvate dehydrogenase (quinone)